MHSLYLGLRKPEWPHITHFPVIRIEPLEVEEFEADWIIFTSQTTVEILSPFPLRNKVIFAVGEKTAEALRNAGFPVDFIPKEETQEGLIALLETMPLKGKKIYCGRSSRVLPGRRW